MMAGFGKKEEIYGFETFYRELSYYLYRIEQYEKSLRYFNETIKKTPNDKRALMGRAYARSKVCEYQEALEDIRTALKLDPDDLVILANKALNTYLNCSFEEGLIQNTRMLPKRKMPDHFSIGIMHCTDAIENCVGQRAGHPLRDHFKIIRRLAWAKNFESQKPFEPKSRHKKKKIKKELNAYNKPANEPVAPLSKNVKNLGGLKSVPNSFVETDDNAVNETDVSAITIKQEDDEELSIKDTIYSDKLDDKNILPPKKKFFFKPLQNYTTNISNYMAEKYLDTMYKDKLFLKELHHNPVVECPNYNGTQKIRQLSKAAYKTISHKQDLLRSRRPFYFIKYQEAVSTGALKKRQEDEMRQVQKTTKKDADIIVRKINRNLKRKDLRGVLDYAEKLKLFCDSKSIKIFPDRENYLQIVYDAVCQAHFDIKRLNSHQGQWDQEKRIFVMFDIELSREPSTDSVIDQFKNMFIDWRKQITLYGKRLRQATTPEEMAWLYHELSRYHLELKQFELSRVYARKCITEGRRCNNLRWVINAMMLITKVNMVQHNKNDAKTEISEAIEVAKLMDNNDLEEFLNRCLKVIEEVEFGDVFGTKIMQEREQKIIKMMPGTKMKDEAAHLFRKMSAMPASRRMSVMPGVQFDAEGDPKGPTQRMSIMPVKKDDSQDMMSVPNRATKGKKDKKVGDKKGIEFVELIQYHVD